jgi:hypothetical protein
MMERLYNSKNRNFDDFALYYPLLFVKMRENDKFLILSIKSIITYGKMNEMRKVGHY